MPQDSIDYARFDDNEPRNSRGQTLTEYLDQLRHVHAALKGDMFYNMAQKKKATDVATHAYYEGRIKAISKALATARKRGRDYGITLD